MWFIFLMIFGACGIASIIFLVQLIRKKEGAGKKFLTSIGIGFVAFIAMFISLLTTDFEDVETASTNSEEVKEEEITEEDTEESESSNGIYSVNESFEINGLEIIITDVEITEDDIKIGMELANNSESTKTFYPDQGDIVIGSKQIGANMFMTKGEVSGEIHAGVEKSGTIQFLADDDDFNPDEIGEIKLMFGNVMDDDTYNVEEFAETITIE